MTDLQFPYIAFPYCTLHFACSADFAGGKAHHGISKSAVRVWAAVKEQTEDLLKEHGDYQLVLTGAVLFVHSELDHKRLCVVVMIDVMVMVVGWWWLVTVVVVGNGDDDDVDDDDDDDGDDHDDDDDKDDDNDDSDRDDDKYYGDEDDDDDDDDEDE